MKKQIIITVENEVNDLSAFIELNITDYLDSIVSDLPESWSLEYTINTINTTNK